MDTNTKVCQMILQKIMEDPQSGSCLNLSYADVTGPVANFNPTGSPYATKPGKLIIIFMLYLCIGKFYKVNQKSIDIYIVLKFFQY